MSNIINTNMVTLTGQIASEFEFSHAINNKKFYMAYVNSTRSSGTIDRIPILVSDNIIDTSKNYTGMIVSIIGTFRSYNNKVNNKTKLVLSVLVKTLQFIDDESVLNESDNVVTIDGFICKAPVYRKTPLTKTDIVDVMIAVNRQGNTDYIPCICWHDVARYASALKTGDRIKIIGRIQSRSYKKKINDDEQEIRTAYELSINKLELISE